MSTYSEAWAAMDPNIRQFYVNWADINSAQNWHVEWDPIFEFWYPFAALGQSFPGYLGFHIAQRNWGIQTFDTGSFDTNRVLLTVGYSSWTGNLEPQYDAADNLTYGEAPIVVPQFCYNYPRSKYKVRKSYWTGAPRRRRNL